jgi:hypothetical protein
MFALDFAVFPLYYAFRVLTLLSLLYEKLNICNQIDLIKICVLLINTCGNCNLLKYLFFYLFL